MSSANVSHFVQASICSQFAITCSSQVPTSRGDQPNFNQGVVPNRPIDKHSARIQVMA